MGCDIFKVFFFYVKVFNQRLFFSKAICVLYQWTSN